MFKNPRGLCLIVNIYQIDGMPPRRWSDRDTESLKQLFEQLLFNVKIYTDSTHDLSCKVIVDFVSFHYCLVLNFLFFLRILKK
jgi:hypothetical protein